MQHRQQSQLRAVPVGSWSLGIASKGMLLHTAWQQAVIFTGIPAAAEFGGGHGGALQHDLVVVVVVVTGAKKQLN